MPTPLEIQSVDQWNTIMQEATDAGRAVVVDFHAEWCGPCKMIAPRYNLLASQTPQAQFLRVDVDAQPAIAQTFHVSAMPTFFAIKSNSVVGMLRGADPQGLTRLVREHAGPKPEDEAVPEVQDPSTEPTEPARL